MSLQSPCLYCSAPESSEEEVISSALGCKESIRLGVCRACNNAFGHSFEGSFVNGLALFRNFFKIPNKIGVVPPVRLRGKIGSEDVAFTVTGHGRAEVPPQLLDRESTGASHGKTFRLFNKAQEHRTEKNLRSKHPDLDWNRLKERKTKVAFDVQPDFDPQILCSADANRSVAKYAVNLLVHQYGIGWVRDRCSTLLAYVKGEQSLVRAGILWEPDLLRRFPFAPPKHLFVLACDSRNRSVEIFIYLFSLLPFYVSARSDISVDSVRTLALDPANGRFMPLFLSGSPGQWLQSSVLPTFPMPEFEFLDQIGSAAIGTIRQASLATADSLRFMKAYLGTEVPHICYNCQKILRRRTEICEYCGKSPLPEDAVPLAPE